MKILAKLFFMILLAGLMQSGFSQDERSKKNSAIANESIPKPEGTSCSAKPRYPLLAMRQLAEGETTIEALISVDGQIIDSRIKTSSGNASLDAATLTFFIKSCKFTPLFVAGTATQTWVEMRHHWRLE